MTRRRHVEPSRRSGHRTGPTLTERVAGWSAGHRKTAVVGWLLLVAAIFMGGQALGPRNMPSYDAGQSGQAERVLNQVAPAQDNGSPEKVLIQAKTPGATFATDPAMRQAASQVAAALAALPGYAADIRTPLQPGGQALVSKDGRSALVTFQVPGNVTSEDKAVAALQHAVAGVQASHPNLRIAETGDASIGQAINSALNFSKAEATSVPITLILLLAVFGALVAAGHPGAARADLADRRDRGADDRQPLAAGRQQHLRGRGDHRHGGRRRLLAVLPAPRA